MRDAIVMYAQNGAGLGHFRRCANIAAAFVAEREHAHVLITSRSIWPAATLGLPPRCDVLKLPAFAPLGTDQHGERRVLHDREDPLFGRLRSGLLHELLRTLRPASVLVDNEPRGLGGELLEPLAAARRDGLVERVVLGLRDIRGSSDYVVRKWASDGTADALASLYDSVLVYGDARIFDTAAEYGLGSTIPVTTTSVGYVFSDRPAKDRATVRGELGIPETAPLVAVLVGSGADGHSVLSAYLEAAMPPEVHSVLLAGPLMPAEEFDALHPGAGMTLLRSADAVSLAHAADAVICRGGYNSIAECVHAGHVPLVVPRVTASREQQTRAAAFAAHDLVDVLEERDAFAGGRRMVDGVLAQLERGRRRESPFDPQASVARAAAALA
jgi:predicted glycosyltransferase